MTNRCEDFPCCGHALGECADRPEFTSAFYLANPRLLGDEFDDYGYEDERDDADEDEDEIDPNCEWCVNPNAGDATSPETLCRWHEAEYEGVSVDELDRRDREQAHELL